MWPTEPMATLYRVRACVRPSAPSEQEKRFCIIIRSGRRPITNLIERRLTARRPASWLLTDAYGDRS